MQFGDVDGGAVRLLRAQTMKIPELPGFSGIRRVGFQDGPLAQRAPKRAQSVSGGFQDSPREPREAQISIPDTQDASKTALEAAKTPQEASKGPQKRAPRGQNH